MIDQNDANQKGKVDLFDAYVLDLVDVVTPSDAKLDFAQE